MAFVGLDFGTTTSILSYMDGSEPRPFNYGGQADRPPYIPTVVAYRNKELLIGHDAIEWLPHEARIYRYFKMLLPENEKEKWPTDFGPYATDGIDPTQVTADFIGELICGSSAGRKRLSPKKPNRSAFLGTIAEKIDGLVVSVPQVWSKDASARGRQQLQMVVNDLGLPLMHLISEPVAAAAYFTHSYAQRQRAPYLGNLLICDMGGGTFDVTLCKLAKDRVEVLHNEGNGERGLGIAGAQFDLNLLNLKLPNLSPDVLTELLIMLDQQKKMSRSTRRLEASLQQTPEERDEVEPIYSIASLREANQRATFGFEDIEEAFRPVRDGIFQVLNKLKVEAERLNQPIEKVVMVGGFSKFPLVQKAVGDFFEEDVFNYPKRIDLNTLSPDDMAFAISYGACLVANEMVHVTERYEHTIGIVVYSKETGEATELPLIRAGQSLDSLQRTKFFIREDGRRRHFLIKRESVEVEILIRLLGSLADSHRFVKKVELTEVPNSDMENKWFLGTGVDKSRVPYLVLEDVRGGVSKTYPLADLIPPIIMLD